MNPLGKEKLRYPHFPKRLLFQRFIIKECIFECTVDGYERRIASPSGSSGDE
jgi:hypothetical protein